MFRHLSTVAALTGLLAGAGFAAPIITAGPKVISVTNISETVPTVLEAASSTNFVQIPGAVRNYSVTGPGDLFTVTFSAESQCRDTSGDASAWCAVRIVASQGSTIVPFHPYAFSNSGNILEGAFDSNPEFITNADEFETHSLTQSRRLPTGVWTIRAQYAVAVNTGSTTFQLDDWNLSIVVSD